jgi:magnesium transporter
MRIDVITLNPTTDQREVARLFGKHGFLAMPVVDGEGCMVGVVTIDDVVEVEREAATEDIQKIGGVERRWAPPTCRSASAR